MIRLTRHARGLLAAVAVLALTAGVAFAGRADPSTGSMPDAAATGLDRAAGASGTTVPVAAPAAGADQDEDQAEDTDEDAPAEDEATDEPADDAAEHPDNHGATVSAAATGETPDTFDNHGQFVRSVATDNAGHAPDAERGQSAGKGAAANH